MNGQYRVSLWAGTQLYESRTVELKDGRNVDKVAFPPAKEGTLTALTIHGPNFLVSNPMNRPLVTGDTPSFEPGAIKVDITPSGPPIGHPTPVSEYRPSLDPDSGGPRSHRPPWCKSKT